MRQRRQKEIPNDLKCMEQIKHDAKINDPKTDP